MAAIDYAVQETSEGEFDLVLPLAKTFEISDLLFQQVDLLLNTYTNEFLYDITQGMPYDDLLGKSFDLTTLETVYYGKISPLVYFNDLIDFQVDITAQRVIEISFKVVAVDGNSQEFNFSQGI